MEARGQEADGLARCVGPNGVRILSEDISSGERAVPANPGPPPPLSRRGDFLTGKKIAEHPAEMQPRPSLFPGRGGGVAYPAQEAWAGASPVAEKAGSTSGSGIVAGTGTLDWAGPGTRGMDPECFC